MKHLKLFSALLLTAFLSIGQVWAETADVTYDFTTNGWTVSNGTLSNGTVSFTGAGGANFKMNTGYFMLGKKDAYLTFPTYPKAVEKIVITGTSGASESVKQNIYVDSTAVSTETTGAKNVANKYAIASGYQAAGTTYVLKVTSAHNTQISKIEVFYVASTEPTVSVTPKSLDFGTVEKDAVVAAKTFALTGSNLTDANKVTITAPDGYKVSIGDADPATSLQLTPSSKKIASTTIKVTPVTSVGGTYNSNITISSDDLDADSTVALKMTVVTPVPVTGVTLNKSTLTLADGDSETLIATIAPNDATNKNVTWESDDDAIATVDENGLVTGVKIGTATITCKSVADNTKTATCEVTVNGPDVVLDFKSNTWGFPKNGTDEKATTEESFTSGDYTITLGGGYLYYPDNNNLLVGKTDAYLILPAFAGKAIARIVTVGEDSGSKDVVFNVFEGTTAIGTAVTSCKVDQTFNISPKKVNTRYTLKITNNYNARFGKIKIYFGEPDPVVTFATPENGTLVVKKGETAIKSGDAFVAGTVLTVEAEPESADYKLQKVTINGATLEAVAGIYSFTIGTEDVEVGAVFSVATALDNTEAETKAVKFIENGQLFILRGEKVYTVQGQLVK